MKSYGRKFAPNKKKTYNKARSTASRKPVKTIAKNTLAIRSLQSKVNGHLQMAYHACKLGSNYLAPSTPLLFACNDFTRSSQGGGFVYKPIYTGTSPNIETVAATAGNWASYTPNQVQGLGVAHQMWTDNNDDTTAKSAYQPVYAEYRINFNRQKQDYAQPDTYIRIDIITAKRVYLNTAYHKYSLPNSLGSLQNMAVANISGERNAFNPALFSVKTKWIKIPQTTAPALNNSRTHVLRMSFPKKLLKLDLDVNGTVTEEFYSGVDPTTPIWCMLSASAEPVNSDTSPLEVTMTRKITWRDQFGSMM